MQFRTFFVAAACAAAVLTPSATSQNRQRESRQPDIVQTAQAAGSFKTLVAALKAADLVDALRGKGPFTVLAPTDDAFAKLGGDAIGNLLKPENKETLQRILKNHVVSGRILAVDAIRAKSAETQAGTTLNFEFSKGSLRIANPDRDGAVVVDNDLRVSNGVIHVIDSVLVPAPTVPTEPRAAAIALLQRSVEDIGAPAYNDGNIELCVRVYETTLFALRTLGNDLISSGLRGRIDRDLAQSDRELRTQAFALRARIDEAYRELTVQSAQPTSAPAEQKPRRLRRRGTQRRGGTVSIQTRPASPAPKAAAKSDEVKRAESFGIKGRDGSLIEALRRSRTGR